MEQAVRIGEHGAQLYAARRGVDDAADRLDAARPVIDRTVVEHQPYVGHVLERVGDRTVLTGQVEQLVLGHREVDVYVRVVRYGRQRLRNRCAYQRADTVRQGPHHAVGRSLHDRIGEVVGGVYALRFGLRELGLGGQQRVFGRQQVVLRNHVLGVKLLFAVVGELRRGYAGFGSRHVGFCGLQRRFVRHLIYDEKGLAFRNGLTLVYAEFEDGSRNLRIDGDVLTSADGRRVVDRDFAVGSGYGHHGVFRGAHCRRCLSARNGCHEAGHDGCFHKCLLHNSPLF